jgi:hypothetical protein
MKVSPSMLAKLDQVRDIRLRLAEQEKLRADQELAASKQAEEQARTELANTQQRSADKTAQANQALLGRTAGGRMGISEWHEARRQAEFDVRLARGKLEDAVSTRVGKEMDCSTARDHWRGSRFEVERLRLLSEQLLEKKQ